MRENILPEPRGIPSCEKLTKFANINRKEHWYCQAMPECVSAYISLCMYAYVSLFVYLYVCMYACMFPYMYSCMYVCIVTRISRCRHQCLNIQQLSDTKNGANNFGATKY